MTEKTRKQFREWYKVKGEDHNRIRRMKYKHDPEARKKANAQVQSYRENRRNGKKVERVYLRTLNGEQVQVYGSSYVADQVGVSAQTILNWEARGWISKSVFKDSRRFYTESQMNLIGELADFLKDIPARARHNASGLGQMIEKIQLNWSK